MNVYREAPICSSNIIQITGIKRIKIQQQDKRYLYVQSRCYSINFVLILMRLDCFRNKQIQRADFHSTKDRVRAANHKFLSENNDRQGRRYRAADVGTYFNATALAADKLR